MMLRRCVTGCIAMILGSAAAGGAPPALGPENVLILWNSERAESQAIRDAYVALYPGVREFDLDNSAISPSSISRASYTTLIRNPLRDFLNGVPTGDDISDEIVCIVTTRGLPGRINGADEFDIFSTWSSMESDLVLLQQDFDLTQGITPMLPSRDAGPIDNPWHLSVHTNKGALEFDRSFIKTPLTWVAVNMGGGGQTFRVQSLTPAFMYLVCRLDAAPTDEGMPGEITAVEHTIAMLGRAHDLWVGQCDAQVLLDEYGNAQQLDDDGYSPLYPVRDDFGLTSNAMTAAGWEVTHDETNAWIEQGDLAEPGRPLIVFGTYGENHDAVGAGEDPPGAGTYVYDYLYHRGCVFISYESFNGDSIVTGNRRQNQAQALEFISAGGTFAVPTVKEPFTFSQTDLEFFTQAFYGAGFTFAEAAYMAMPTLSWQSTPIGDPLARVRVYPTRDPDVNGDLRVDVRDLYAHYESPSDMNCDGAVDAADGQDLADALRLGEADDIAQR